jgi:hypothetical protein
MGLLAHQSVMKTPVARTLSLQLRDSSRRRAGLDTNVDAARKSARHKASSTERYHEPA